MSEKKFNPFAIFILAVKLGPKLASVGVKLLKGLKFGKVGLAAASAASYTMLFTWQFSLAIMAMLFIHESGHVWAMKKCGIKTKGFYFIPFIGGAAVAEESFKSRRNETYIALMGPVWGLLLALVFAVGYQLTGIGMLAAVASWMALVNLINLLPVNPLDGGRILKSVFFSVGTPLGLWFMGAGCAVAIYLFFKAGIFIFALLFLVGVLDFLAEYKAAKKRRPNYIEDETERIKGKMAWHALSCANADPAVKGYIDGLDREEKEEAMCAVSDIILSTVDSTKLASNEPVPSKEPPMPPMSPRQVLGYSACSIVLVCLLLSVMSIMNHVPEAALAREILYEGKSSTNTAPSSVEVKTPVPVGGVSVGM